AGDRLGFVEVHLRGDLPDEHGVVLACSRRGGWVDAGGLALLRGSGAAPAERGGRAELLATFGDPEPQGLGQGITRVEALGAEIQKLREEPPEIPDARLAVLPGRGVEQGEELLLHLTALARHA